MVSEGNSPTSCDLEGWDQALLAHPVPTQESAASPWSAARPLRCVTQPPTGQSCGFSGPGV